MKRQRYRRHSPPGGPSCFRAQLVLAGCILCAIFLLFLQLDVPYGSLVGISPSVTRINRAELRRLASNRDNPSKSEQSDSIVSITTYRSPSQAKVETPKVEGQNTRTKATTPSKSVSWTFNYPLMIRPTACHNPSGHCNFTESIVICVSSGAGNFERRQAVRRTWGSQSNLRVLFFFGANESFQPKLLAEANQYNDIVQYDFQDSYLNLTLKSVSMLRFVSASKWDSLRMFMKADDDTFVNVRLLPKVVKAIKKPGIFGSVQRGARPRRAPKDKWYIPREEFSGDVFPTYVVGCFYIIPIEQMIRMAEHATEVHFLRFEDTYVTGILAEKLHIRRYPVPFASVDWTNITRRMSHIVQSLIAKHYVQPTQMLKMFNSLNNPASKA